MCETFAVFLRKLLGTKWERVGRSFINCGIIAAAAYAFYGSVPIRVKFFYLILFTFTAGAMWKALSSEENTVDLRGILLLPIPGSSVIRSCTAALAVYTVITKTSLLLTGLTAASGFEPWKIINGLVCASNACLCAAVFYFLFRRKTQICYIAAVTLAATELSLTLATEKYTMALSSLISLGVLTLLLGRVDPCSFCYSPARTYKIQKSKTGTIEKGNVFRYLFRYMASHGNYTVNTLALCGLALMFSFLIPQMGGVSLMPMGFALLTLNTPVSILLSSDRKLCRGIHMFPGQIRQFAVPYGAFTACSLLIPESVFFISCVIQYPEVGWTQAITALLFILQSALLLVALEWRFPITKWKIESDLYHHPRKYVVPVIMLLCSGIISTWPQMQYMLALLLTAEAVWLIRIIRGEMPPHFYTCITHLKGI